MGNVTRLFLAVILFVTLLTGCVSPDNKTDRPAESSSHSADTGEHDPSQGESLPDHVISEKPQDDIVHTDTPDISDLK